MVGNIKYGWKYQIWLEILNYGWKYQIWLEIANVVDNIKLWLEISNMVGNIKYGWKYQIWLEISNMVGNIKFIRLMDANILIYRHRTYKKEGTNYKHPSSLNCRFVQVLINASIHS